MKNPNMAKRGATTVFFALTLSLGSSACSVTTANTDSDAQASATSTSTSGSSIPLRPDQYEAFAIKPAAAGSLDFDYISGASGNISCQEGFVKVRVRIDDESAYIEVLSVDKQAACSDDILTAREAIDDGITKDLTDLVVSLR